MNDYPMPRILDPAPNFEAVSTHGVIRLSDYTLQGLWVLLFSHPADFTPVCSSEFIEFARRSDEFDKLNVQLVGISIDSVYSHIAWVRELEATAGISVKFPIVADLDQKVSRAFGMVHEAVSETETVRAVFAIDPKGKVRAIIYYPAQLGRNIDELVRLFAALQIADANAVCCPADWRPGEQVMLPAPLTLLAADKQTATTEPNVTTTTWYMARKQLPAAATKAVAT